MGPETFDPEVVCQSQLGGVITTGTCSCRGWSYSFLNKFVLFDCIVCTLLLAYSLSNQFTPCMYTTSFY